MGIGFLKIHTTTGGEALPVSGATVRIKNANGDLLYETATDANGLTQNFEITAPDKIHTLDPDYGQPAYSVVDVEVTAPGYITKYIKNVEIVDTQNAYLPVDLRPQAESTITEETLDIVPPGILSREPYLKEGTNEEPPSQRQAPAPRLLSSLIIPDYITVHLGAPSNTSARNVRVKFPEYVKNVASSEIYSTWPYNSLISNIHAITTFALNRVYTEWYRNRGYNFDITNNTAYDQAYREGGPIYENISEIVDAIFNVYAHRFGFGNPYFTSFCNGTIATCAGLSQWGTVTLANQGFSPIEILRYYFPKDIVLSQSNNITGITESFPGYALREGNSGEPVRRMQNFLNRIRVNFPLIPQITNPNGVFGPDTTEAVKVFQRTFNLTADGIIGRATWNKISQIYVGIARIAELNGEGTRISIGATPPNAVLSIGSRGNNVLELQFILNSIAAYYNEIPTVIQDSIFAARDREAVIAFQRRYGLTADGVVGPATWNKLYEVYHGIRDNVPVPPAPPVQNIPPFPGTNLRIGSTGANVRLIQQNLNVIRQIYSNIPAVAEDGIFGLNTQRAVIAFQQQFMLTPDGIVGPITWNKIMEQYNIATGNAPAPIPPPSYFEYTVIAGDSLWLISRKFGTTVEAIKELNRLTGDLILVGQVLRIPNTAR